MSLFYTILYACFSFSSLYLALIYVCHINFAIHNTGTCPENIPNSEAWEGNCYFFYITGKTRMEAEGVCYDINANLLSLSSEEEYNFVKSKFQQYGLGHTWLSGRATRPGK